MIFLVVFIILFYFYIDCDFITLFYHFYRNRVKSDGYYGKTLWIVGASSGMGEHLVYEAVKNLASCVIISARRTNELERVEKECKKIDANCTIIIKPLDLLEFANDRDACANYMKTEIMDDPNINNCDILVINSGITQRGLGLETDLSVINRLLNINVLGVISFIQAFVHIFEIDNTGDDDDDDETYNNETATKRGDDDVGDKNKNKRKRKRRGSLLQNESGYTKYSSKYGRSIFVTSSLGGKIGSPGQGAYCLTKHGINGFLESIRAELYRYNVHVGIVCPGPIGLTQSSLGGLGNDLNSESGRKDTGNESKRGNKMKVERCAQLYTTAIMMRLSESWISRNPQLLFVYIKQYLPFIVPFLYKYIGPIYMKKLIAGQKKYNDNNKNGHKEQKKE